MSDFKGCDFCPARINTGDPWHTVMIDDDAKRDCCDTCFNSPVILAEHRRTRTRKAKAKPGRPKGSKNKEAAPA